VKELSVNDLVPPDWATGDVTHVWLAAYRSALQTPSLAGMTPIDVQQVRVVFVDAELTYQALDMVGTPGIDVMRLRPQIRTSPRAFYTLFLSPFDTAAGVNDEPRIRQLIGTTVGLVAAFNGGALVFERVFDNVIDLVTGQLTGFSAAFKTPVAYGQPRFSTGDLAVVDDASKALSQRDEMLQARVRVALQWFHDALHDDTQDEFIKLWVAVEALAMPDTTNVKPVNEILASSYGITAQDAAKRFGVGKLHGMRSRILHRGEQLAIHGDLTNYVRALFTDVLLAVLGLSAQHRADAYMQAPTFVSPFDLDALAHVK